MIPTMFSYTEKDQSLIIAQKEDPSKSVTLENWDAKTKETLGIELSDEKENINSKAQESLGVKEDTVDYSKYFPAHLSNEQTEQTQAQTSIHPPSVQEYVNQFTPNNENMNERNSGAEL